jgi:uncharacterized protein (TIGR03118 family)
VVVTYAKQNATKTAADDNCGDQCGFVDVFTGSGRLVQRLENGPGFQAPWGITLAPQDFGFFSHALLIGNRFTGTIAAYDATTGNFLGNLLDATVNPLRLRVRGVSSSIIGAATRPVLKPILRWVPLYFSRRASMVMRTAYSAP